MCFAVNQQNLIALKRRIERWGKPEDSEMIWTPQRWVDAFTHPLLPAVLQDGAIQQVSWGLIPQWARDEAEALKLRDKTFNATCENFYHLPSFRDSARVQRCLIPVNGFYEYQHSEGGKHKTPYLITFQGVDVFFLAGIWAQWRDQKTFSLLTMPANTLLSEIHNSKKRMPVIVGEEWIDRWMTPGEEIALRDLFTPHDQYPLTAEKTVRIKEAPEDSTKQGELF